MNDMRDLSTVNVGEPVYVYAHGMHLTSGTFMGAAGRNIVVADASLGILNVDVDSVEFTVEDADGRLLGRVMADPPLVTVPPELE